MVVWEMNEWSERMNTSGVRWVRGSFVPLLSLHFNTLHSLSFYSLRFFHYRANGMRRKKWMRAKGRMQREEEVNDDLGSFFTLLSLNPFSRFNEKWNKKERITRSFCSRFIERRTRIPFNSTGLRFPSHCNSSVSFGFLWGKDTKWKWEENHMLLMHILFLVFSVLCYNLDSFSFFSL